MAQPTNALVCITGIIIQWMEYIDRNLFDDRKQLYLDIFPFSFYAEDIQTSIYESHPKSHQQASKVNYLQTDQVSQTDKAPGTTFVKVSPQRIKQAYETMQQLVAKEIFAPREAAEITFSDSKIITIPESDTTNNKSSENNKPWNASFQGQSNE